MPELAKYAREFVRAVESNKFEKTGSGLYFPKAKAFLQGTYFHSVNGEDEVVDHNLLPDEGMAYLLLTGLAGGTAITKWYLAPYTSNYTPTATLTAANFVAAAGELVSNTEGYTEATRPQWKPGAVNGVSIDNLQDKATFTFATQSTVTIHGVAMVSEPTKGAVTGKIMSATKFTQPRTLYNGDVLSMGYRVQLVTA